MRNCGLNEIHIRFTNMNRSSGSLYLSSLLVKQNIKLVWFSASLRAIIKQPWIRPNHRLYSVDTLDMPTGHWEDAIVKPQFVLQAYCACFSKQTMEFLIVHAHTE